MSCPEDCARFATTASVIPRPKPAGCVCSFTPASPCHSARQPPPTLPMPTHASAARNAADPCGSSVESKVRGESAVLRSVKTPTHPGTRRFQPPWQHDHRASKKAQHTRAQPLCPREFRTWLQTQKLRSRRAPSTTILPLETRLELRERHCPNNPLGENFGKLSSFPLDLQ